MNIIKFLKIKIKNNIIASITSRWSASGFIPLMSPWLSHMTMQVGMSLHMSNDKSSPAWLAEVQGIGVIWSHHISICHS